jgi:hypothetical protein
MGDDSYIIPILVQLVLPFSLIRVKLLLIYCTTACLDWFDIWSISTEKLIQLWSSKQKWRMRSHSIKSERRFTFGTKTCQVVSFFTNQFMGIFFFRDIMNSLWNYSLSIVFFGAFFAEHFFPNVLLYFLFVISYIILPHNDFKFKDILSQEKGRQERYKNQCKLLNRNVYLIRLIRIIIVKNRNV